MLFTAATREHHCHRNVVVPACWLFVCNLVLSEMFGITELTLEFVYLKTEIEKFQNGASMY